MSVDWQYVSETGRVDPGNVEEPLFTGGGHGD